MFLLVISNQLHNQSFFFTTCLRVDEAWAVLSRTILKMGAKSWTPDRSWECV